MSKKTAVWVAASLVALSSAVSVVTWAGDSAAVATGNTPTNKDSASVPRYNDTLTVQHILNECGLVTVKVEKVTVWDSGRVVSLDLSNKDFSQDGIKILPAAICSLTQLRTLLAKDNGITAIPVELFTLKRLQTLNLANNKISFIPPQLGELVNLDTLDLRYNGFGSLPPEIGKLKKLVSLQLWGDKIIELEPVITTLPLLKDLYLKDNRLTTLPEGITAMKSLAYIDLQGNSICKPPPKIDTWLKKSDKRYRETQKCWEQ
jgi:Leucine rich repeat